MPGLFDELGVLGGDGSTRLDFYEIFTNNSGADVIVDTAVVFGGVNTASTAVIVGLTTGTLGTVSITFPNLTDVRASAAVPVSTSTSDPGCFASPTSGFTACPITIRFSPGVLMPAGTQLAFGFIVPETKVLDAFLWGTDTIDGGGVISSTTPPYWTGFYATDSAGTLFTAVGDHYLAIEASAPTIQQVLAFFDSSAAAGTLTGSGPGNSGESRLRALRNMLESAANLIGSGDTADAILQLHDAYLRTDGLSPPPDFVTGPAAPELASLIQQLIASLGG